MCQAVSSTLAPYSPQLERSALGSLSRICGSCNKQDATGCRSIPYLLRVHKRPSLQRDLHCSRRLPIHRYLNSPRIPQGFFPANHTFDILEDLFDSISNQLGSEQDRMTLDLPNPHRQDSYLPIPAEYEEALKKARAQFEEQNDPAKESEWEDAGEREEVKLFKKTNPENAYDVPIVKGITTVENATPSQVLAVIQQPGMRKKWDPRFDDAAQLERYGPQKFLFYTYLKSPSYFVWARDIVGVQENTVSDNGDRITVIQTSVDADKYVDEAGSYSKSRTRATLEVSAWDLTKQGNDTKLEYIVKIHLNGSLPTSVVSMVATETPMCVGRVRDIYYSAGHLPYDAAQETGVKSDKSILIYSEYADGDGTEATSGEKRWTIWYHATGEDTIKLKFDNQRLYPSLNVKVEGEAADHVTPTVDQAAGLVTVQISEAAKGKGFSLVFTP